MLLDDRLLYVRGCVVCIRFSCYILNNLQIFERAVTAIHCSVDLWCHYVQFKLEKTSDAEATRM